MDLAQVPKSINIIVCEAPENPYRVVRQAEGLSAILYGINDSMDIAVATHKIVQMLQNGSFSDFKEAACKQYFTLAFEAYTLDAALKVLPIFQQKQLKEGKLPANPSMNGGVSTPEMKSIFNYGGKTPQQASNSDAEGEEKKENQA